MEYISHNPAETDSIFSELAARLRGGDLLALYGELGSGKTTSVKAIGRFLGVKEEITSPTFVIIKNYHLAAEKNGIKELVHMDAYRLHGASDAESVGLNDYLARSNTLTIIEWPENIGSALPQTRREIHFEHLEQDCRGIKTNF